MTDAERLRIALDLADFGKVMVRQRLMREHPESSPSEIDALFEAWLYDRPGAENGDGEGRLITLPRTQR